MIEKAIEAIKKHNKFLITAHVNLEGDSLGSQLAMKILLDQLGKTSTIVDSDPAPEHFKFLSGAEKISNDTGRKRDFEALIVLDCPTLKRIGRVQDLISKDKAVINIDHHISNENFGHVNWVEPNASSAGEMVYRIFKAMGVPITKEAALVLYIAILTDTGSFNYENTSSLTHEIAGELLGYGLEPAIVSENVYERRSVDDIKFLALVLSTLKVNPSGDIAYLEITRSMLKDTGADASKSEGFINYARSIEKTKIAILFKENSATGGRINVSFRAKGDVDVNALAASFGGGGHTKASGCVVEGSLADVEKKILAKAEEVLRGK
jgi:phosphoesterase RecJ-like protein